MQCFVDPRVSLRSSAELHRATRMAAKRCEQAAFRVLKDFDSTVELVRSQRLY